MATHSRLSLAKRDCRLSGQRYSDAATPSPVKPVHGAFLPPCSVRAAEVKKHELKAALRAAARVAREREFFPIGSQAIHAHCKRAPAEVLLSQECDLYPRTRPEAGVLLDREMGRNSAFARKYGFYVDVVTPDLASLPEGWQHRVKRFRAGSITAFCLEIHDLLASKLAAGRLKDLELTGAVLKLRLAKVKTLRARIAKLIPASVSENALLALATVLRELRGVRGSKKTHG